MLGFAEAILEHLKKVNLENTPEFKITPTGYMNILNKNKNVESIPVDQGDGHRRQVRVKFQTRSNVSDTQTTDDCNTNTIPAYQEVLEDVTMYRQIGFSIPWSTIAKYESDASAMVGSNGVPTKIMNELLYNIMNQTNGLLQAINQDLMAKQATSFGINASNGLSTAKVINLPYDITKLNLTEGLNALLQDYQINEGKGTPQVFGSGLMHALAVANPSLQPGLNGLNQGNQLKQLDFYYDPAAQTILGANKIGVLMPNSSAIIKYNRYRGSFSGKFGLSYFGTIVLPMQVGDEVVPMEFDFQLQEVDCPTPQLVGPYKTSTTLNRYYNLFLSLSFDFFQTPTSAWESTDRLAGTNGSMLYSVTNDCDECP